MFHSLFSCPMVNHSTLGATQSRHAIYAWLFWYCRQKCSIPFSTIPPTRIPGWEKDSNSDRFHYFFDDVELKIIQRKLWTSISTRSTESNCFREHFISRHASWTTAYDSSRLSSEESYEGSVAFILEQFITFPLPVWLFAAHMREVTVSVNV